MASTIHMARSAAVRWLDGDAAAVAELRTAAPLATSGQRALLDALFADAAFACGHAREAMETARRVVRGWYRGVGPQPGRGACWCSEAGWPRARWRRSSRPAMTTQRRSCGREPCSATPRPDLRFGDGDAAEQVLDRTGARGPLPWDPAERTAPRARLTAAQGHPAAARHSWSGRARPPCRARRRSPGRCCGPRSPRRSSCWATARQAMADLDDIVPVFHAAAMARLEASSHSAPWVASRGRWARSTSPCRASSGPGVSTRWRRSVTSSPCSPRSGRDDDARAWLAKIDSRPGEATAPIDVLRGSRQRGVGPAGLPAGRRRPPSGAAGRAEIELLIDLATWHHRRARWADVYEAAERAARLHRPERHQGVDRAPRPPRAAERATGRRRARGAGAVDRSRAAGRPGRQPGSDEQGSGRRAVRQRQDDRLPPAAASTRSCSSGRGASWRCSSTPRSVASGAALGQPTGNPPDARR